ncbi:sister chromatid cohesion and DNA repair protein [Pseudovirgaria hyperparasitica]|uniref:Sister chromatid cohesion and DNA repair protein n=1 Tax=Pseudovirgaria hyperparasitica TaxID=470096 RepID=A0A6A6WML4_9PEZI|nr:sister chromatid cohesion and DNA repair protein [Pseudovirgaria hyperparasitica]KAF2763392.1 sister chromatid cohesion and DNA repair protein [Pseudovirgaria hyperparasitica]
MARTRTRTRKANVIEEQEEEDSVDESVESPEEDHEEQNEEEGEDYEGGGTQVLQFNKTLTWKAGRAIPVADLLRRLQELCTEMRDMEQDEVDTDSLRAVSKELATPNLLGHKDRGIRAWTACALADIFRLCAPNAPYNDRELKSIFELFVVTIIPALADPSNPYDSQHKYVLRSLAEVKSVVILADIRGTEQLLTQMFTACFDVLSGPSKAISGEDLSKNVEHHMTIILSVLADETDDLPTGAIDVILAQFLRADPRLTGFSNLKVKKSEVADEAQSTAALKEAPAAYNMAKNVCNNSVDKMSKYITTYFSQIIADASNTASFRTTHTKSHKTASSPSRADDSLMQARSDEDMKEISKAHRMLRELWRSTPNILDSIIPQLDAEIGTEDTDIRLIVTETIGDMVSGIGAAGPPPATSLNPNAYPSQGLIADSPKSYNFLTTPVSLLSFPLKHASIYNSFLSRRKDKSPVVRAAVATGLGRILMTSAGGVGLESEEVKRLLAFFSDLLVDTDERVRLAVVKAIENFNFWDIVHKLGNLGGISTENSILHSLSTRTKDPKPIVRVEATKLLAKIWGVASGAISEGQEQMVELFGPIPSRIFDALYINDPEINTLVNRVLHESLLPLGYPPIKAKASTQTSQSQRSNKATDELTEADLDKIRVERVLILMRDLEDKAKTIMIARQGQQGQMAKFMEKFLSTCEAYNGGVMDKNEKETKTVLGRLIEWFSKSLPETQKASEALWKFAKIHDRRSYALIRFAMAAESDYRKVYRSIKELTKKIQDGKDPYVLDHLLPLVYQSSSLIYNRSHLPAIIQFSRTNEKNLGDIAHEVLKQISEKHPDIFKAHVKDLCKTLEGEAPSATRKNGTGAVQDLKACAGFARKFAHELPKDRKFLQSMINYALYGTPAKAAKHAVTILMAVSDKKAMHAREVASKCVDDFEYGSEHYLSMLAALSQLALVASKEIEDQSDGVFDVAVNHVLLKEAPIPNNENSSWTDQADEDCTAKIWALKLLVNRVRAVEDVGTARDISAPVYKFLNQLVSHGGELTKSPTFSEATKSRMRLTAAHFLLKLSCIKRLDPLLSLKAFNQLSLVAQDPSKSVRAGFVDKLMKYLGLQKLPSRFYTILFLLPFEPDQALQKAVTTWIRSRALAFKRQKDTTMEALFSRFLSLLAHHPDFATEPTDLLDFVRYIMFYLKTVASQENLGLIYHVAQRTKAVQDAIDIEKTENLYILSDLAQATIRTYQDIQSYSMQTWPGKIKMPGGLFAALPSPEQAQEIATTQYIPEEVIDEIEAVVRDCLKNKKRKPEHRDGETNRQTKRAKASLGPNTKNLPVRKAVKTPKSKKKHEKPVSEVPSSDRRRSGRHTANKSYIEHSDDEDDEEMEEWDQHTSDSCKRKNEDATMSDLEEAEEEDEEMRGEEAEEEGGEVEPEEPQEEEEGYEGNGDHSDDIMGQSDDEPDKDDEADDETKDYDLPSSPPVKRASKASALKKSNGVKSSPATLPNGKAMTARNTRTSKTEKSTKTTATPTRRSARRA